jgi:alkylmercury lyase-like protein
MPITAEDVAVRCCVYDIVLESGRVPARQDCAHRLSRTDAEIAASLERLHAAHQIVLAPNGEILMAMPFSAVPTPFVVSSGTFRTYANCGWDALGVAAMLHCDATVSTSCSDCGDALEVSVADSRASGDALLHFALPVRHWWDSVVFT